MASVKTAMWAQGAISGCGAAGSDSKNMARRRQFKTTWFQLGFHTVLGNLQLIASRSLTVTVCIVQGHNKDDQIKDVQPWFNTQHSSVATVS